jgi:hypothetical protein
MYLVFYLHCKCVSPAYVSALYTLTALVCMCRIGIVAGIIAWQVIVKSLPLNFAPVACRIELSLQGVVTSYIGNEQVTK